MWTDKECILDDCDSPDTVYCLQETGKKSHYFCLPCAIKVIMGTYKEEIEASEARAQAKIASLIGGSKIID